MARRYALKFKAGTPVDDAFLDFIDGMFAELNIPPAMAQQMADKWQGYAGQRVAAANAERQREIDSFKAELGSGYNEAIASGQRAARSLGLDGKTLNRLQEDMGTAPMLRLLSAVGQRLSGAAPTASGSTSTSTAGNDPLSSPEQARAEIDRLSRDPAWHAKLFDKNAAGHVEAKQSWAQLHAAGWPTPEPAAAPPDAPSGPTAESRTAARQRVDSWLSNADFMQSIGDKSHPDYRENRQEWDNTHAELGSNR